MVDTDAVEIQVVMKTLINTEIFKSNHESIRNIFATDGTNRDLFRCILKKEQIAYDCTNNRKV